MIGFRSGAGGLRVSRPRSAALALLVGAAALLALAPATSRATPAFETSFMDDQLLLGSGEAEVRAALTEMRSLGADRLRVSAYWYQVAPGTDSASKPQGFDGANHQDPQYRWAPLDRAVRIARELSIPVMITITGPGPLWTSGDSAKGRAWRPNPAEFGAFAQAVATRYAALADRYAVWNEPNQGAWLQPQSECSGSSCRITSPDIYRDLAQAAFPRIRAADPSAMVLIGELAPSGRDERGETRPVRPLLFLRRMACRSNRYQRMRRDSCANYSQIRADAIGHHPYNLLQAPRVRARHRDDATLADTRKLLRELDTLTRRRAMLPQRSTRFPVYYTEFGYQTNPPDPIAGVSVQAQRRWLNEAAFMAWRDPRVRELNQFRLTDGAEREAGPEQFREFMSGLRFRDNTPKPAYETFPFPIHAERSTVRRGQLTRIWGKVRTHNPGSVRLEHRVSGTWRTLSRPRTDRFGNFTHRFRPRATRLYRFVTAMPDGSTRNSESIRVRVRSR